MSVQKGTRPARGPDDQARSGQDRSVRDRRAKQIIGEGLNHPVERMGERQRDRLLEQLDRPSVTLGLTPQDGENRRRGRSSPGPVFVLADQRSIDRGRPATTRGEPALPATKAAPAETPTRKKSNSGTTPERRSSNGFAGSAGRATPSSRSTPPDSANRFVPSESSPQESCSNCSARVPSDDGRDRETDTARLGDSGGACRAETPASTNGEPGLTRSAC